MFKKNILSFFALSIVFTVSISACNSDVPEPTQKGNYTLTPFVDYSLTDLPEFVDDISQFEDTDKQYVLPDGYLYEYKSHIVPTATNQLQIATDINGSVYNECGYEDNARIRSILEIGESDHSFVTGFIPVESGDIIYFSGNVFDPQYKNSASMHIVFYDSNKQMLSGVSMLAATEEYFEVLETNMDGYISAVRINEQKFSDALSYIRFTLIGSGSEQIISVNESLSQGYEELAWIQTEQYVSADWYKEINTTVESINNIELDEESDAIKFIFATDIHLDPYSDDIYTESIGKVCAEVMYSCDIPFFVTGGDNSTQSAGYMPTVFEDNMKRLLSHLSPIPKKNILLTVGNHDGETGTCEYNGETVYYRFQLNNEERSFVFFDWQRETNEYKKFDSDGTYYYIDDSSTKTRYILLNSFWSQWEGNEDGFVTDIQHSFGHTPIFGPQQLKWFAEEALDMPPEYGAVIITHFAPDAKDFDVFKGIVDAFSNQTVYQGSYIGDEDWQNTNISVNYENSKGEIIAVFQGHRHTDAEYDYFQSVPCINTTTTGAFWAVRDENAEERIRGTSSEFAVDSVVIDKTNRKIYLTRLGAGNDRVITFK